jgi:AsmA protein
MTSAIQTPVEHATGYRIAINGPTRIGLWPAFNLTLHDVSLAKPAGGDSVERTEIASLRAAMPLAGLLFGRAAITELTVTKPVVHLPLLRERRPPAKTAPAPGDAAATPSAPLSIDHLTVSDGALVFANPRDGVEDRIEAINITAAIDNNSQIAIAGDARSGINPFNFVIRATAPDSAAARRNIPVELSFKAPTLLAETLTAKADVRIVGTMLRINGVAGTLGSKPFTGWASVDLASKPLVKVDLDLQDLAIGTASSHISATPSSTSSPWSDAPLDVAGLNYIDADIRISAAQLTLGQVRIAPLALGAPLERGVLKANFENLGLYDGLAHGELTLDASGAIPAYSIRGDIDGVRALPMLSGLADFDRLEGKLQAKFAVQTTGATQRALMSGLDGTAFVNFRDGKIRGLNVAQMIRSLTTGTLSGWQTDAVQSTDLSQLSASFRIAQGKAVTSDLALAGPLVRMSGAGTIDLAAKALALRVDPKLVMTLEGQGSAADPIGLGIPVAIDGPWASPRIYPDVAGMLDNPDTAYARLRELGEGLFGTNRADPANKSGNSHGETLGETLGGMIRQGLGGARQPPAASPDTSGKPHDTDSPSPIDSILKQLFSR